MGGGLPSAFTPAAADRSHESAIIPRTPAGAFPRSSRASRALRRSGKVVIPHYPPASGRRQVTKVPGRTGRRSLGPRSSLWSARTARNLPRAKPATPIQGKPMTVLELSRWQFGITTVYHFIFVPLTLSLSYLVAIMQTLWRVKKDDVYLRMTKFF